MKKNSLRYKMLAMLLAALLGMSLWSTAAAAAGTNKVVVTAMNFRKTPAGVRIGSIPAGTTVVFNYSYGEWDNVTYNGTNGWIHSGNLKDASAPTPPPSTSGSEMSVVVTSGYLALRNAKAYDSSNEIGKLYTGETVNVQDTSDSTYWYVYSPKLNKSGYVNSNYLVYTDLNNAVTRKVKVQSGYLALRTGKAFDSANEIGKLYTGDTVQVTDPRHSQYWYVYAPSLGKYGFVNKDYLVGGSGSSTGTTMTVKVQSGYLALRTAKAYDASNEIGKLYTGETVQVQDTSDSQYWYVYAPSLGKSGYVNKDYLVGSITTKTVKVQSGYLALRNAKAYDASNEIGKLYTGETVQVQDTSDSQYWYVYAPSLGKSGYVNKDYLY